MVHRWSVDGQALPVQSVTYDSRDSYIKWKITAKGELVTSGIKRIPVGKKSGSYRAERAFHLWTWRAAPRLLSATELKTPAMQVVLQAMGESVSPEAARAAATPTPAPTPRPLEVAFPVVLKKVHVSGERVLLADDSRLWDAATGRQIADFKPMPPIASAVDIAPDAAFFASAGGGGFGASGGAFMGMWEMGTRRLLWHKAVSLEPTNGTLFAVGGERWATSLLFSPDGNRLLMGSALEEPPLALYDVRTGKQIWKTADSRGHSIGDDSNTAAWSPDGRNIAAASTSWDYEKPAINGQVQVVDAAAGSTVRAWELPHAVTAMTWSPDSSTLAVATSRGAVRKYDHMLRHVPEAAFIEVREAGTGRVLHTLESAPDAFTAVRFSPDGNRIVAGARDGSIRLWHIATGALIWSARPHARNVNDVAWRGTNQLISVAEDGTICYLNARQGTLMATAMLLQPPQQAAEMYRQGRSAGLRFGGGLNITFPVTQWLIYTPDGMYDASPGAEKYIRWRVGTRFLPASSFRERFHKPQLLQKAISAD
jgi:WD40 repeat protein